MSDGIDQLLMYFLFMKTKNNLKYLYIDIYGVIGGGGGISVTNYRTKGFGTF